MRYFGQVTFWIIYLICFASFIWILVKFSFPVLKAAIVTPFVLVFAMAGVFSKVLFALIPDTDQTAREWRIKKLIDENDKIDKLIDRDDQFFFHREALKRSKDGQQYSHLV